jgi:hypothetical protein
MQLSIKLKPFVKQEWVEALRSGKYPQTSNVLMRTNQGVNSFCCLGVLAVLNDAPYKVEFNQVAVFTDPNGGSTTILSPQYFLTLCDSTDDLNGSDIEVGDGRFLGVKVIAEAILDKLTRLNDEDKKTFPEIADWVDKSL